MLVLFGLLRTFRGNRKFSHVRCIIAGLTGTYLLIHFQLDLSELRGRIEKAVNYSFGPKEKQAFTIRERDPDRFSRGGHILFALTLVCIGGAALSVAAVWVKAS